VFLPAASPEHLQSFRTAVHVWNQKQNHAQDIRKISPHTQYHNPLQASLQTPGLSLSLLLGPEFPDQQTPKAVKTGEHFFRTITPNTSTTQAYISCSTPYTHNCSAYHSSITLIGYHPAVRELPRTVIPTAGWYPISVIFIEKLHTFMKNEGSQTDRFQDRFEVSKGRFSSAGWDPKRQKGNKMHKTFRNSVCDHSVLSCGGQRVTFYL